MTESETKVPIDARLLLDALRRMDGDRLSSISANVQQDPQIARNHKAQADVIFEIRAIVNYLVENGELPRYLQGEMMKEYGELSRMHDRINHLVKEQAKEEPDRFTERGVR